MSLRNQVVIWIAFFVALFAILYVFRSILLPFVVGAALAYLLNPLVNALQRLGLRRGIATGIVLLSVVTILVSLIVSFMPLAIEQVGGLIARLPGYATELQELARRWAPELNAWLGAERAAQLERTLEDLIGQAVGFVGALSAEIIANSMTVISVIGFFVFTPVIAFYMLLDWDGMVRGLYGLLPRQHASEIEGILHDIDSSMGGVIRGQGGVILILAAFYATSLTLAGLNFGLAIGLIAGLMSFIPYVGFAIGFVLSIGVAIVQFWPNGLMIVVILVIFMVGQFLEGNILYPKLVGSSININPVWLMFALLAFGFLFGFLGLLLAVPLAAIGGVLVRFGVRKYKASTLYRGQDGTGSDQPA